MKEKMQDSGKLALSDKELKAVSNFFAAYRLPLSACFAALLLLTTYRLPLLFAAPVTNLSYTLVSSDTLSLQWDLQPETSYQVVLSTVAGFSINLASRVSPANQNTTSFYALQPNTSHTFLVKVSTDDDTNYVALSTFTRAKSPAIISFAIYNTSVTVNLGLNTNPVGTTLAITTANFETSASSSLISQSANNTIAISGLTANTTYLIQARAVSFNNLASSATQVASTATLPNPPSASAFVTIWVNSITVNWNSNGNSLAPPTSYQMQVSTDSNFTIFTDSVTFTLTASSAGLTPNTTYYFRVRTTGVSGVISSFDATLTTLTLPAAPSFSAFNIFATSALVTLQANNNPAQTTFRLYASTDGFTALAFSSTGVSSTGGTAPRLLLSGLAVNATYQIGADCIAFNNLVSSRTTISNSTSTLALPPSDFLSLVSTNIGVSSISVSWQANGNPLAPPTSYQLQVSTDIGFGVFSASVTFNLSLTTLSLSANTSYYFRARAFSRMGEPTAFNTVIATFTLPQTPFNFASTQSVSSIRLFYQSNNSPATKIEISSSTDNFATQIATPIPFSANFTGSATTFANLREDTSYFFRLRARSTNNLDSDFSVVLNTKTATLNPEAVSALTSDRGGSANLDGRVRLRWTAPADNAGTADERNVSSYIIRYATFEITASNFDSPLVSTYVQNILPAPRGTPDELDSLTGLNPGTTYYFALKSKDAVGNLGLWNPNLTSHVSTFTWANDLALSAPTNPGFNAIFSSAVTLSFSAPPSPANVDDRDSYKIYYATYNFSLTSDPALFQTTSAIHPAVVVTVTGLANETTYYFRVSAVDKGDQGNGLYSIALESGLSASTSTITLDRIAPSAISDLTALTGTNEGEIVLTWTAPGDDGTTKNLASGSTFEIKYSSVGILTAANYASPPFPSFLKNLSTQTNAGTAQAHLLTGLVSNVTYWFAIKTMDESGNISVWNSSAEVATVNTRASTFSQRDFTAPAVTTGLTLTGGYKKIILTWISPGDDGLTGNVTGFFKIKYDTAAAVSGGIIDTLAKYEAAASTLSISTIAVPGQTYSRALTGLSNNTTYAFAIRSIDDAGNIGGMQTGANEFPKNQAPATFTLKAPADNFVLNSTPTTLFWDGNPQGLGADLDVIDGDTVTYVVEYSTNSNFSSAVSSGVAGSTPSFSLTGELVENSNTFWRVKARDLDNYETISNTRTLRINFINTVPSTFSLLSPTNTAVVLTSTPTLDWQDSFDPDPGDGLTYTLKYSQNADAEGGTTVAGLTTSFYLIPSALLENTTYYWKVSAISTRSAVGGGQDEILSNATFSFRINNLAEAPNAFTLLSPQEGERVLSISPTFSWNQATDNDPGDTITYELTITNIDFSTTIANLTQTTYTYTGLLSDNRNYLWKVKAKSSPDNLTRDGTPLGGQLIKLDTVKELPPAVTLSTPTHQALVATSSPTLKWTAVTDPDNFLDHPLMDRVRYIIKIGKRADYSDVLGQQIFFADGDGFQTQRQFSLEDQTTYFWQVAVAGYQPIGPGGAQVHVDTLHASTGIASSDCQTILGGGANECYRLSAQFSFIVSLVNTPPSAVNLLEPQNNAVLTKNLFAFDWSDSIEQDPAQKLEYKLEVATDSNFNLLFFSTTVTPSSFTLTSPLLQNRTYYWRIFAQDRFADGRPAGNPVASAQTFSFKIPILTTPKEPTGVKGALAQDKNSFTVSWNAVTQNTNGSAISDLANYLLFRSQSTQALGSGTPFAQVAKDVLSYTDSTIAGGEFFYTIRAVNSSYQTGDSSGTISINSLVVKSAEDQSLLLVPEETSGLQGSVEITIPENTKSDLGDTLKPQLQKTNAEGLKDALFGAEIKIRKVTSDEEMKGFTFTKPIRIAFSPFGATAASKFKTAGAASNSINDYAIFWNNGAEWLNLGGAQDPVKKTITAQTRQVGEFAIRQVSKATSFELSAITPTKIFSPNGDGCNDIAAFQYQNPKGVSGVKGKIFDLHGTQVAEMKRAQEITLPAPPPDCPLPNLAEETLVWDGKDSDGNLVRKGIYIYQIEAEGKVVNGTIVVAR